MEPVTPCLSRSIRPNLVNVLYLVYVVAFAPRTKQTGETRLTPAGHPIKYRSNKY